MNIQGHLGFGYACLIPVMLGKKIPYINIDNEIINGINTLIHNINMRLEFLHTNLNIDSFITSLYIIILFTIGIRFPDFDTIIIKKLLPPEKTKKRYIYHRQITHSFLLTILGLTYIDNIYIFSFFLGMFTHIIADMLTGSVPLFFIGKYYKTSNIFYIRIGIDMLYIYGFSFFKDPVNKIKVFIVKFSDLIGPWFYLLTYLVYIFPSYFQKFFS